ncbi:MAG: CHAT domain-containing protein [Nitrospirae bacterium]|nr:CHAT domain-containing protein [Nitrospirota bacterium]
MSKASAFILDIIREGEKLRVSAYEKAPGDERTLRNYEEHSVDFDDISRLCKEVVALLNRANRRGDIVSEVISDLKKTCQNLYDELLTSKAKNFLRSTSSDTLVLYLDDQLVHIPWELLFDGEEFFCLKFSMGRIVSTRQSIAGVQRVRKSESLNVLIMADPQGNLEAAYKEGIKIRDELSENVDKIRVSLVSSSVDRQYVKKNIRDFDIVHYAGHAAYDLKDPSQSGWIMSDGKLSASDVTKMAGGAPLPALIFSNACHSGRTGEWNINDAFENEIYGLANAFLISGVAHYIGTFFEVLDSPSSVFAIEFYKALAGNASIGEAVLTARRQLINIYGKNNIIWASYMLYGDPVSKILTEETATDTGNMLQTGGVSKADYMNEKDALRSPKPVSRNHTNKAFTKAAYGIITALILVALFFFVKSPQKSLVQQVPSVESQPVTNTMPLELSMNIIGQREEDDGSVSEVIIREGGILHSYDNFQLHFNVNKEAYVYILIYDSNSEASQLFPDPKIQLSNKIVSGKDYSVPSEGQWFWLDENVGTETIYVLASERPLDNIQKMLKEMEGVNAEQKKALLNKVRSEIQFVERGVGGVTEGKAKGFHLKDGKSVQSVTEIVKGTGAVVRAVSFRHIDNKPLKIGSITGTGKEISAPDNILIGSSELSVKNLSKTRERSTNEKTIENSLKNIKNNIMLEESRGVGGVHVYKEASPAVVLVVTNEGFGSGSVLDKQGNVLTNWHVINGYERVVVFFKPKKEAALNKENAFTAKVLKVDEITDLALLRIEQLPVEVPVIKIGSMDEVEVAQEVHAIGHPEGEIWTYTKGIISQIRPDYKWSYTDKIEHKSKVIQTQTPINPGNSGGPLLNDKAELIGINSFVKKGEGLNFAVSGDVINEFMKSKESRFAQRPSVQKASFDKALENAKYYELDLNNDGITDVIGVDLNGNEKMDMYIVDLNHDKVADYIGIDRDENGKIETRAYDTDNNGKLDTWAYDNDEDKKVDLYGIDHDEDGKIDEYKGP